ncbi:hypothetical protein HMJ29_08795 [Hymenobacter taeanensis]|uniref:G-D-S-L family lipolytic protein n=1 Tax=Hymenobacter taeanensis TaxID=2735321 RepID=A0A6M6BIY7_9BACT|nr:MULTISPECIES: hypothetical protein [Hymenobacter]QJX47025.1 hypothetical protein HMJ29_08795 [Hymenobacter taeanensis]UOQ80903.1 SGNH/GDSL hydrolase family protein [Hymenobacter sp. 5414T-23]
MNTKFLKNTTPFLAAGALLLGGCQPDIDAPKVDKGSADFTRYIAVGNSLTAGFMDNGLYLEGQQNSYPSILAQQFQQAGGGEFVQPLFNQANQQNGSGFLRLTGFDATGSPITTFVPGNAGRIPSSPASAPYTKFTGPINNLGVPGIRLADIQTAKFGNIQTTPLNAATFNPYFERITPDGSDVSYFQRVKAEAATATFFTTWLGNNDVLGFATSGGASTTSTITRTDTFTLKSQRIINVLTANGAKGVVSTIPDVTGIPFFTTVGPRLKATLVANNVPGLVIQTGAAAGLANSTNRKQIATTDIRDASGGRQLFTLTGAPFVSLIGRPTGRPWRFVYAQSGQPAAGFPLFLAAYGIDTLQALGVTAQNPFPSAFVLDDVEQGQVNTATTAFNNALRTQALAKNLAIFDANVFFTSVSNNGFATNGVRNTAAFISGNLFSLDGVHPTPRGYAAIANEMIKVINAKYGSSLQLVDPNQYRGVLLP